jgi:hypothetical protein
VLTFRGTASTVNLKTDFQSSLVPLCNAHGTNIMGTGPEAIQAQLIKHVCPQDSHCRGII